MVILPQNRKDSCSPGRDSASWDTWSKTGRETGLRKNYAGVFDAAVETTPGWKKRQVDWYMFFAPSMLVKSENGKYEILLPYSNSPRVHLIILSERYHTCGTLGSRCPNDTPPFLHVFASPGMLAYEENLRYNL